MFPLKYLGLLILAMHCLQGFSQVLIKGKISDDQSQPLSFATVKLLRVNDSTELKTTLSDSVGNYIIACKNTNESLLLQIDVVGYSKALHQISPIIKDTLLWNVTLHVSENILNNITVSNKAPLLERKVDRTVFNVANSIAANGSDAYDLLKKTPGVQVSNGTVSITGKSTVSIMINDRLQQVDADELEALLRSMPATDISKIEVITAPPAKNDAQGNSGIINFVTKKIRKNGLNGTLTAAYEQRTKASGSLGGTFNYRKDKLNIYGNTDINDLRFISPQQTITYYPDQQQNQILHQDNRPLYTYSQVGVDYTVSRNAVLGLLYTHGTLDGNRDENYNNEVTHLPTQLLDSTIITKALAKDKGRRNVFDLNYEWKADSSGSKLTINVDYFTREGNKDRAFNTSDFYADGNSTGISSDNKTFGTIKTDITSARIDYEMPVSFATLTFGAKASAVHNNSDNVFKKLQGTDYITDTGKTNTFDYHENTQAAYISAQKNIGKWSMQLGLRAEYTQTKGYSLNLSQANTNNYFKLFPTAYLQYKLNDDHNFNINYSRRIDRPSFWIMNPFRVYSTETSYEQGNPFLQPAFSNNFEIGYSYKSIFSMTVFTQRVNGFVTRISNIDTVNNSFNFGQANAGNQYQYGVTATISWQPLSRWESTTQLFGTYNRFNSTLYNTPTSYSKPSFAIVTNNTITLNTKETFQAQIDFVYNAAQQSDFDIQRYSYNVSAGLKALCMNKKLILTLDVEDIFKTDIWQVTNLYNGTYQYSYFDNRVLRLALTWKFGNKNIQAKRALNANSDEMKRAN